jgi:hypothetical protein
MSSYIHSIILIAEILSFEHATIIISVLQHRYSFMMTEMELRATASRSSPTQLTLATDMTL